MKLIYTLFCLILVNFYTLCAESMSAALLASTESDSDAVIHNCCNVINGDYCESATDLMISGPDTLCLQRYYNSSNYITGEGIGGWRIFPQAYLILGTDLKKKKRKVKGELYEWVYAYTGERSGGILTYSGWKLSGAGTKNSLIIRPQIDGLGMVNTYSAKMSGQTNHLNNYIDCTEETCELYLGDGTKRLYQKTQIIPNKLLGEELFETMASKVGAPQHYRLIFETLPSGNIIHYSYNEEGRIASVEIQNASADNIHSWIQLSYQFNSKGCTIEVKSSDEKSLTYKFSAHKINSKTHFTLKNIEGSHCIPTAYEYNLSDYSLRLTKKILPEKSTFNIDYDNQGKVKFLKSPDAMSGKTTILYSFFYGDLFTDVKNAANINTRYRYDLRHRLFAIEYYDQKGKLHRTEEKHYGKKKSNITLQTARIVKDNNENVVSCRSFNYDKRGNILEEKLYGNLTGKIEIPVQIGENGEVLNHHEEACHSKKFTYSTDGYNLLTSLVDSKENVIKYLYEKNSNRLKSKFLYQGSYVKNREFYFYNKDAVCVKIIKDDGYREKETDCWGWGVNKRLITDIQPKQTLPGLGLPEIIEEKTQTYNFLEQALVKKLVNTYSPQGSLLSCSTYDSKGDYAYAVSKTYNHLGQITSETDPEGKTVTYSYDKIGNCILLSNPHEQKVIETQYDCRNNPIQIIETSDNQQALQQYSYDILDRKITSIDRYGQTTYYDYDDFGHLIQIIHPAVLDEHNNLIQPTFSYEYDIFGNVIKTVDPKGYITEKQYTLRGDPTKITYSDGTYELFKYDPEGSLHRSMTRDRIITVYEYDYLGRVIHEEVSAAGKEDTNSRENALKIPLDG